MLFDDRLATVLRSGAAGEQAARTQYRQLLDLLGSAPAQANGPLMIGAYRRLAHLEAKLPPAEQARILREPWLRLRNPRLLAHLAEGDPQAAAAAMATARLEEDQWTALIPQLPMVARGFLRHRRDLPSGAKSVLARLGVRDLVLPEPTGQVIEQLATESVEAPVPTEPSAPPSGEEGHEDISALVRRIEAFQQARRGKPATLAPRLPLEDGAPAAASASRRACDFTTDASGRVDWAEAGLAPLLVGTRLDVASVLDAPTREAMKRHQPVRGGRATIAGAPAVAGEWRLDAAPRFSDPGGAFAGYRGRLRRPSERIQRLEESGPADRMRQVLHELRTPVNAVQGFAEIIQQQLFGPAPNNYRALAAAIGVDAARLLAGFDEIDRMVRLESGVAELSTGGSNLSHVIERTLKRLEGVMRPRSARMRLQALGEDFAVNLGPDDAAQLAWRLLATMAGALAPGEVIELVMREATELVSLEIDLPIALSGNGGLFDSAAPSQAPAVTAGMFGSGFTMRLARAEVEAAGGSLIVNGDMLVLTLPALTGTLASPVQDSVGGATA